MTDYKDFEKYSWHRDIAPDSDVVVSTRIRLARNLQDYPFSPRLDDTGAAEIIGKVRSVPEFAGYEYTDLAELPVELALSLGEKHIISPEFAAGKGRRGLLADPDRGLYLMLCEEDHVRLQCIMAGCAIDEAYASASKAESAMDKALSLAYSERFGYLTHCPTNLGTGMRASVMLFLPAISAAKEIASLQSQLTKLGLTVRGMSGEGSSADGCLYQISNQITLGVSEEETLKKLSAITKSIVKRERELRGSIGGEEYLRLRDRVRRAMGIMGYAELIDTKELFELYSKVRLGAAMGMADGITCEIMDRLLFTSMPATLTATEQGRIKTAIDRDAVRAEKVRAVLSKI